MERGPTSGKVFVRVGGVVGGDTLREESRSYL